ncbi:Rieske 2Fe-2S domain-containing protein [Paenibacillus sp. V4I7]|uniref:Rieske (2Fe-2S) protein n=1 Tax=Paenibacillus sp. V4I7 TaxID=3042307 RepID=UPI002787A8F6|nr:Rieske 2Fe-2S domain-containing protein [Paenibacillus sp. V4I7]MDQ0903631.1 anthranilate 1,2-dioxygenase ferredoxin subunit [Paenibacillus sp. V4I7]
MKEIELGPEQRFTDLPAEVEIESQKYWILKNDEPNSYRLVSRKCPHAGGLVEEEGGELVCPLHGWEFDSHTGVCLNVPSKGLTAYTVVVKDGLLVAKM